MKTTLKIVLSCLCFFWAAQATVEERRRSLPERNVRRNAITPDSMSAILARLTQQDPFIRELIQQNTQPEQVQRPALVVTDELELIQSPATAGEVTSGRRESLAALATLAAARRLSDLPGMGAEEGDVEEERRMSGASEASAGSHTSTRRRASLASVVSTSSYKSR